MITDKIQEYMQDPDMPKLWEVYAMIADLHAKQQREAYESGYYDKPHATSYCPTYGCQRQGAYKVHGVEGEAFQWRAHNTFAFGYSIEILVKTQMFLLGIPFEDRESFPLHWQLDGKPIYCSPDCYNVRPSGDNEFVYVVEIKSASAGSFSKCASDGVRATMPGYYDQMQLEITATNSAGAILVMQNKNTAHLYEEFVEPDRQRLAELDAYFLTVHDSKPEHFPRALQPIRRVNKIRGKKAPDSLFPLREWYDKNGKQIGWFEILPEADLPWNCGYCAWKHRCWAPATVTNIAPKGEKPQWELRN
ncbi:MAG: hypothetical protein GWN58_27870 [Anaerolineae bacterium]|nr:hypothetical protein [Anaerolineae bacterium]